MTRVSFQISQLSSAPERTRRVRSSSFALRCSKSLCTHRICVAIGSRRRILSGLIARSKFELRHLSPDSPLPACHRAPRLNDFPHTVSTGGSCTVGQHECTHMHSHPTLRPGQDPQQNLCPVHLIIDDTHAPCTMFTRLVLGRIIRHPHRPLPASSRGLPRCRQIVIRETGSSQTNSIAPCIERRTSISPLVATSVPRSTHLQGW